MNQQVVSLLYIVALFALLYFLLIRPQQQRQKKHMEMIRNLKVNDPIVTIGGIYGTIVKIKDDTLVVRVADNVRIEILKNAVAQVRPREEEEEKEK
ncbi:MULTISPECIES: preprotein translocase subunit YajC [Desulfofundulus]|uniref:Preprotein translocase subunit YajC n=3 Tax=Desulfofundulus TaxID=2282741 RepID=A0A1M6H7J4_9FIRM|nr:MULTISPECIES: preprotein translocase subunit YajC [Desulfofundulus]MDQ0287278.1 preprotein translocase subunit YajC [Desulfofundulus luciae]SHJ18201.1 preprotein translocase subunit YajC [Desulfofundulus thermosubterraneus DSM 16057]